jgi:alpha/beta superfamily hydrolase
VTRGSAPYARGDFPGPEGRLEGRYHPQKAKDAPIAIILHPHPQFGGTMNNRVVYNLHYAFHEMGFTVLRFNFRGVGRSQGEYDQGVGELSDAASALDYLQSMNPNAKHCWVAGFSFGAWIGMQLLMRRPEITGFISVSPPANMYDFSFLAPCPSSGLIINGTRPRRQAAGHAHPRGQAARAEGHHHHPRGDGGRGPFLRRPAHGPDDRACAGLCAPPPDRDHALKGTR